MMKYQKICILISFLVLGGYKNVFVAQAQDNAPLELSFVPSIGFNYSYYDMADGYTIKDLTYTRNLIAARNFYWGIGLQTRWKDDWVVSAVLSNTWMGGGYNYVAKGNSTSYSEISNDFALNFEKKLWTTPKLKIGTQSFTSRINLLLGAGVHWIPTADRVVESNVRNIFGVYSFWESTPINNVTGHINIGVTNQFFHNNKPRLKIGLLFSYAWQAARSFDYKLTYTMYNNAQDDFVVNTGKYRLLLYAEVPIILYRNKAQKELIFGKKKKR